MLCSKWKTWIGRLIVVDVFDPDSSSHWFFAYDGADRKGWYSKRIIWKNHKTIVPKEQTREWKRYKEYMGREAACGYWNNGEGEYASAICIWGGGHEHRTIKRRGSNWCICRRSICIYFSSKVCWSVHSLMWGFWGAGMRRGGVYQSAYFLNDGIVSSTDTPLRTIPCSFALLGGSGKRKRGDCPYVLLLDNLPMYKHCHE